MNRKVTSTVALTLGLILASATVIAETDGCDQSQHTPRQASMQGMHDNHMGKLRIALQLTPAQEAAWKDFAEKMKPAYMAHATDRNRKDLSVPDRMDKMLENMKSRESRMTEKAAAVRLFYGNLSADQKRIFDRQFQSKERGHMRHALYHNSK